MPTHEEEHIVGSLIALCKELRIQCVVQVGAEDGFEAGEIARATGCRAVAVEADDRCIVHKVDGVEFHNVLIGATDSAAIPFYRNTQMGLSGTLSRSDGGQEVFDLPMRRLDTFCQSLDIIPDALIIDTEGTCLDVLNGATGVLGGVKLIYAEVQTEKIRPGVSMKVDVDAWLKERGFVERHGLPSYGACGQGNFTYVRSE